jgi:hypothetical protein
MTHSKSCSVLLAIATASILTGCHHAPQSDLKVATIANYSVVIDTPLVKIDKRGDITTISGTVHRQPGSTAPISGRVDIDFIAPDGNYLLNIPVHARLTPDDSNATAGYSVAWGVVYPASTTVQVRYVDGAAAAKEDLEDANSVGGAGNTGNHGGVHGGNTAMHTGGSGRAW